jgi:hypothetical protein
MPKLHADRSSIPDRYLIDQLKRRDPALFRDTSMYVGACSMVDGRQPLVISPKDKERIDRIRPGSYGDSIKYGSTKEKRDNNIYICPRYWCPRSRTGLQNLSDKCPLKNEHPWDLTNSKSGFFKKGDARHIGFIAPKRGASTELCLPCCFKKGGVHHDRCKNKVKVRN